MAETERLIWSWRLLHGGHPVLRYCIGQAAVDQDPAGNRKLNKARSTGRIDAAVALVMATARAVVGGGEADRRNVYEDRGLVVI